MRILIIIPAYNEAENILETIRDIRTHVPDMDYIVINDCSTDETERLLRENGCPFLNLSANLGIGGAVQTGYRYALERGYDIAVQFDGDGQHMARYLRDLIAPLENGQADLSIGSRFLRGEGFQSSALRRVGISFLSSLIAFFGRARILDVTSGMRAANRDIIALFAQEYAQDYPEPESILQALWRHARVEEIPVQMRERQGGVRSINALRSVYYMVKVSLALCLFGLIHGRDGA